MSDRHWPLEEICPRTGNENRSKVHTPLTNTKSLVTEHIRAWAISFQSSEQLNRDQGLRHWKSRGPLNSFCVWFTVSVAKRWELWAGVVASIEGRRTREVGDSYTRRGEVVTAGRRTRLKRKKNKGRRIEVKRKPRRASVPHCRCWGDDGGLLFQLIRSASNNSRKPKDQGRPPGWPRLCNENIPGKQSVQTFVPQSWGKPPHHFPVFVLSNDKCLFYVRIKQCQRQEHKQKLQWHWFCMLVGLLLKRNSHGGRRVSSPEHRDPAAALASNRPRGTNSSSPSDSIMLTLQLPANCRSVFLAEQENSKRA